MSHRDNPPTPEQVEIVRWTASLGAITAEALALRIGSTTASARARLTHVQRCGLLSRDRPLARRPSLFTATRAGLRICEARGIAPCSITASGARHLMVCAAAAAVLERCYPGYRLLGEHELLRDEREQGHPLVCATLGAAAGGGSRSHRPDMVLWPHDPSGLPVAIEVELTVKGPRRLADICRAWARCRTVGGVLYFAPADVQRALTRAIANARAFEQIVVLPLSTLAGMGADDGTGVGGGSAGSPVVR